jgi:three-Cys-motif partner protein
MAESVVGPWAKKKLDRLAKYLNAYTLIMKEQKWCKGYHYIDAFAGPGEHEIRKVKSGQRHAGRQALLDVSRFGSEQEEQQQFLAGSPRVALELQFPFTNYIFVEHSPKRIESLERLKSEFGVSRQIHIRQEDCTKYLLDKIAANPKLDWAVNRALVFLDPFGMQVGWRTIEALASTKAIEIFLNFPVGMAIQRLLFRQPAKFTDVQRRRLDKYFGSPDWITILYKRSRTLFGDETQHKIDDSGIALLRWYRSRLRQIFSHVSKAALIRNTRGGHLYYLLLASHNRTGVKIADDILSAGEVV